ncbi:MAG: GGDEF domain-containing protein [Chloroflexi bacterium]|nr:GGDEF domain-containing protein [Chloroflexota bacterium]
MFSGTPLELVIASAVLLFIGAALAVTIPSVLAGRGPFPTRQLASGSPGEIDELDPTALIAGLVEQPEGNPSNAYDRIVRIVSWVFLLAAAVIVGSSDLWPDASPAIYVVLGLTGLFVLIIHDVPSVAALGTVRYVAEGTVALVMATLLVMLTGGHASPFFFTFPLIVGTASLVARPRSTLIVAVFAIIAYLVSAYLGSGTPTPSQLAASGVNLTALLLLAYVGSVVGTEQRRARDAAIRLSAMDPLTGLFNRTVFFAALDREIARSARSGRGFCLLMLDLDELKVVNDLHGHFVGDAVLRAIAERIAGGVRKIDVAARFGGDEFVALLPETDPTGGWVLAEKIRLTVAGMSIPGMSRPPTVSIGVVAYPRDGESADALMIKADLAMYASKRGGRNRVAGPSSDAPADQPVGSSEAAGRPV